MVNEKLSACNGLLLKPAKNQAVIFSNRRNNAPEHSEIIIDGTCIPVSSGVKNLTSHVEFQP